MATPTHPNIHAKCALISFFHDTKAMQGKWAKSRPYNYLGCSKLSCQGYYLYIQSYNKVYERNYTTRGTHGKFYHPWGLPSIGKQDGEDDKNLEIKDDLAVRLAQCTCQRWAHVGKARPRLLSDSSSRSGGDHELLSGPAFQEWLAEGTFEDLNWEDWK